MYATRGYPSPFSLLERWMEVLYTPPRPLWVTVQGLPLQAWHEGTFRLIGDCLGQTMEVDERTKKKEKLKAGRIEILLDKSVTLPRQETV